MAGTDVLTAGGGGHDAREHDGGKGDDRDPARRAWSTDWGAGPWAGLPTDRGGGPSATQANGSGNGHGIGGFVGDVNGSQMWTYGEDDQTEIWTLRGQADGQPDASRVEAGSVKPGKARDAWAGSGGTAGAVTAPARQRKARRVRARRRGGRSRVVLVSSVAVVVATAIAATAVYALTTKHKTAAARSATRQAKTQPSLPTATPTPHLGTWQYITTRADDPVPLTLAELFPSQASAGPRSYVLATERTGQSCRSAVFGSRLKAAVRKGCSQALRASYLSVNGKRMGTIGALNLATASAAAKVGKVVTAPGQFIQPLQAPDGAGRNLGKGTGVVWAVAKGHYLILMWAQYASLHSPATSGDRKVLLQFVNDVYQKTVNQSLTRRMVTGKPLTP